MYEQITLEELKAAEFIDNEMLGRCRKKVFCGHQEDGIIWAIFDIIGVTNKYFVEFGASDGISGSNTANLRLNGVWHGLLMDCQTNSEWVKEAHITAENIQSLFEKYEVPKEFDFLSIDIDGNDYWVWEAIRDYRARVVCIEYNTNIPLGESKTILYNPLHKWSDNKYYGASFSAMYKLGLQKGYELVFVEPDNMIFISSELTAPFFIPTAGTLYRHWDLHKDPDSLKDMVPV